MSQLLAIAAVELRLMARGWSVMLFTIAFPVLLMLILGGVFGTEPAPEYGGATPADYYVADYVAVPLGALSLIGLPVMIATYRERGVLRRFRAAGLAGGGDLLAGRRCRGAVRDRRRRRPVVAWPVYGVPQLQNGVPALTVAAIGTVTMLAVGTALGLLANTARAAQALGLLALFRCGCSAPVGPLARSCRT